MIHISKDNIAYIEELKLKGYKEIESRIKGLITLTMKDSIPILPYRKIYEYTVECIYCNKQFHHNSLATHIRRKHLK